MWPSILQVSVFLTEKLLLNMHRLHAYDFSSLFLPDFAWWNFWTNPNKTKPTAPCVKAQSPKGWTEYICRWFNMYYNMWKLIVIVFLLTGAYRRALGFRNLSLVCRTWSKHMSMTLAQTVRLYHRLSKMMSWNWLALCHLLTLHLYIFRLHWNIPARAMCRVGTIKIYFSQ